MINLVWDYIARNQSLLLQLVIEHVHIVFLALTFGVLLGIFLGLLAAYYKSLANIILPCAQIMMTVPSIALIGMLLPFLGIGFRNGLVALTLYSLLPIIRNTYTGVKEIQPSIIEAASGMGLAESRILWRIKIPLALPVICAGVRIAVVMIVGIAVIAAFIGAGGLGELIFRGISMGRSEMIITGAIFVSIIAISLDVFLGRVEKILMTRQT